FSTLALHPYADCSSLPSFPRRRESSDFDFLSQERKALDSRLRGNDELKSDRSPMLRTCFCFNLLLLQLASASTCFCFNLLLLQLASASNLLLPHLRSFQTCLRFKAAFTC